jgi:Flp pilus assembly protein TadG
MPSSSPTFVSASATRSGLCMGLGSTFRTLLDSFVRDRSGGSLVVIGLSVPVLFGMVALAVDVGGWYSKARSPLPLWHKRMRRGTV